MTGAQFIVRGKANRYVNWC